MKRKITAIALCAVMFATAIIGGTLAYFTDVDMDTNVMTMGGVDIRQDEWKRSEDLSTLEALPDNNVKYENVLPAVIYDANGKPTSSWGASAYVEDTTHQYKVVEDGDEFQMPDPDRMRNVIDKIVTVTNEGPSDAYVRTILFIEDDTKMSVMSNLEMMYDSNVTFNMVGQIPATSNTYANHFVIEFIYNDVVEAGKTTLPSAMAFWINPNIDQGVIPAEFDIIAYSQAVQADGFDSAEVALDTAFGDVTAADLSWFVADND